VTTPVPHRARATTFALARLPVAAHAMQLLHQAWQGLLPLPPPPPTKTFPLNPTMAMQATTSARHALDSIPGMPTATSSAATATENHHGMTPQQA
jgi:hypothetical protein